MKSKDVIILNEAKGAFDKIQHVFDFVEETDSMEGTDSQLHAFNDKSQFQYYDFCYQVKSFPLLLPFSLLKEL